MVDRQTATQSTVVRLKEDLSPAALLMGDWTMATLWMAD